MSLESDLFEKLRPVKEKLDAFGFIKNGSMHSYTAFLPDSKMKAVIRIDEKMKISGTVFDDFDEEYVAFRPDGTRGSFAAKVRQEYIELLERIAKECFEPVPFVFDQTNRICGFILESFDKKPEYIFEKFPQYAVWRHDGGKWFAIAMEAEAGTFGYDHKIEVIDIKVHEERMEELLKTEGIFPAFHMNKKHWVSIVLDDTLDDDFVEELITQSYLLTAAHRTDVLKREWIVPANPKYFDLDHAFAMSDLLYWKQSSKVQKGDLVYIYYGAPFSHIRYLCEAMETDIPYKGAYDGPIRMETLMRLRKICFFEDGRLDRKFLAKFNVTNIRGPRYMPNDLKAEIIRLYKLNDLEEMKDE